MKTTVKTQCLSLRINGFYGRNRKPKFETFTLLEGSFDNPDLPELTVLDIETLALKQLEDIKFKSGSWNVVRYPVELEKYISDSGKEVIMKSVTLSLISRDVLAKGAK